MFDEAIKQVLNDKLGSLTSMLTSKAGFSANEAKGFLPTVIEKIVALVKGGQLDLKTLDPQKLIGMLNVGELAKKVGIDTTKANSGLAAVVPEIIKQIQASVGDKSLLDAGKGLLGKMGIGS